MKGGIRDVSKEIGEPYQNLSKSAHEITNSEGTICSTSVGRDNFANSANSLANTVQSPQNASLTLLTSEKADWPTPFPITARLAPLKYPIDRLPSVLKAAIVEAEEVTKAPLPIVASSCISVLATAVQSLVDVSRNSQLIGPTSLFILLLADSGERKSTADKYFGKILTDFHRRAIEEGAPRLKKFTAEKAAWEAKLEGIKTGIKNLKRGSKSRHSSTSDLERELEELIQNEPVRPLIPDFLVLDITTERLFQQLRFEWPSCLLAAAEGGLFFGGRSLSRDNQLSTLASFDSIWSGEIVRIGRKNSESFEVSNARLSASIFVQPEVFKTYMETNGVARGIGFLARFLFAYPDTTQGKRMYSDPPENLPAFEEYKTLVNQILSTEPRFESGKLTPKITPLGKDAKEIWVEFYNQIERSLAPGSNLEVLRDFGSKTAENAARLAAVFQASKGFPFDEIDSQSMEAGCAVALWHLHEAERYFGTETPEQKRARVDIEKLSRWLMDQRTSHGRKLIKRSDIQQLGPASTRSKDRLDPALEMLEELSHVRIFRDSGLVEVNPFLLRK